MVSNKQIKQRLQTKDVTKKSLGFLSCDNCGGYYKLKDDETVEDFELCECGGKLIFFESLDFLDIEVNLDEILLCPTCGAETPIEGNFCCECGSNLIQTESDLLSDSNDYEDETLVNKQGKTLEEHKKAMELRSKKKENEIAFKVQEILDNNGFYLTKGKNGRSITILNEGIELDEEQFVLYSNIKCIETRDYQKATRNALGALLFTPYLFYVVGRKTIEIKFDYGKEIIDDVKKSEAIKCQSYIRQKIN